MRVLLIGECYSSNVGDQIVASITKEIIFRLYPSSSVELMDISGRKKLMASHKKDKLSFSKMLRVFLQKYISGVDTIINLKAKSNRLNGYLNVINNGNYDLAIFCGGQVINSTFTEKMDEIAKLLLTAGIPTVYSSIGLGIIKSEDVKVFKRLLEYPNVKAISCRCDDKRFKAFFGFGDDKVLGSFDPGVCASDVLGIKRKAGSVYVGLGIMSSSRISKARLMSFWQKVVLCLEEKNIQWKMFYTGTWKDYVLAREILSSLQIENPESKINAEICSPLDLLKELSLFSKVISFRLHSHILSYSLGIPSVAISWDKKIDDFFSKIGNPERVFRIDSDITTIISSLEKCEYISDDSVQNTIGVFTKMLSNQCRQAMS